MTPEAQNLAIAEACGWTEIHPIDQMEYYSGKWHIMLVGKPPDGVGLDRVPRYTFDLNAMHEAEKLFSLRKLVLFSIALEAILVRDRHDTSSREEVIASAIHSTAAQRAEAYLKIINKWKYGK